MDYDVDRYDDGYALTIRASTTNPTWEGRGLSSMDVETKLAALKVHPRDVIEAIWAADRRFERGTTERTREVVEIWRRAQAGDATPDDVEVLRRELRDDTLGGRRSYLINALHMSGYHDEALELLLELLRTSREWDDVELALRFLSEWSPATYEHVAIPFLRVVDWDKMGVRRSAMAYAGALIRRGEALSLLDELIRVATDPGESPAARSSARFALVTAAGIEWNDPIHNHIGLHSTDAEVASLVEMVRERLRKVARDD